MVPSLHSKRHLDWFNCFCRATNALTYRYACSNCTTVAQNERPDDNRRSSSHVRTQRLIHTADTRKRMSHLSVDKGRHLSVPLPHQRDNIMKRYNINNNYKQSTMDAWQSTSAASARHCTQTDSSQLLLHLPAPVLYTHCSINYGQHTQNVQCLFLPQLCWNPRSTATISSWSFLSSTAEYVRPRIYTVN